MVNRKLFRPNLTEMKEQQAVPRPVQAAHPITPLPEESGVLQDREVLGYGRAGEGEVIRDLTGGQLALADEF